jgi:ligand-binding sensor domain-containing protein/signal transduction histidine kinase
VASAARMWSWVVIYALSLPVWGLDPSRAVTQYVRRSWTTEQGLPQDSIQTIAQTGDGYLWLGTQEGLVRFDGAHFKVFDSTNTPALKGNNILSLYRDRGGTLWVGHGRGVVTWRDGVFRSVPGVESLVAIFGIAETPGSGTMWFGSSNGGLYSYRGGVLRNEKSDPQVIYALRAQGDTLWLGAPDGLWRRTGTAPATRVEAVQGSVYAIYCGASGAIWLGGDGLLRYDGTRVDRPAPTLDSEEIWAVTADRHGTLWIGTRRGLFRFAGGTLDRLSTEEGLSHDFVESLFEDAEGTLWVGTRLGGVTQLRDGALLSYTPREGLSDASVWTVAQDRNGVVWAGTEEGGLNRFDGRRWSRVAEPAALRDTLITALAPDHEGGLWVGTHQRGLHHLQGGTVRVYTPRDGLPGDKITSLLVAKDGSVWIGLMSGLARLSQGRIHVYGEREGLPPQIVNGLHEDRRGRVWVSGGERGGPAVLENGRFRFVPLGRKRPADLAVCMYEDSQGDMWFGTRSGAYRLRGGRMILYSSAHGLPAGTISYVFDDGRGAMWMAGVRGLFRVSRAALDEVLHGRASTVAATTFGTQEGMPSTQVANGVSPTGWRTTDGRLWLATARGIAVLDPRVELPSLRTRPLIDDVSIDAASVPLAPSRPVTMSAVHDRLGFRFTLPTFAMPGRVRFRYRLEGYDAAWVNAGERRAVEYTNLPPGRYRFLVEASDGGPKWLSAVAPVVIERLPAIYQTPWFVLLCAAAVVMMAWLIHEWRMRALRLRHELVHDERRRISLEFHDMLASGLTGAVLHIQSALDRVGDRKEAAQYLETGKGLVRSTLTEAKQVLWNLRSEPLEERDLGATFTSVMELMTKGLPVRGSVEVAGRARRLRNPALEHHLLRIGQEAITNALRHSGARNVRLFLEFQRSRVILAVRDDGRGSGRHPLDELAPSSLGLRGMQERATQMNAKFTARTVATGGFEILVEVNA